MQNFTLENNKYGFEIFRDLHTLDTNRDTYFEIFVLEKAKNQEGNLLEKNAELELIQETNKQRMAELENMHKTLEENPIYLSEPGTLELPSSRKALGDLRVF